MIISSLGAKLAGGECDCPNCRKTEYRSVLLTGDAAKAITDFETVFKANTEKIDALQAEIEATSQSMWETVQAATGTQDIDGLKIDDTHASAGFIFLRAPVTAPTDGDENGSQPTEGSGASTDAETIADHDFEEGSQPEQPPIIIPAAA
ncbi:hypothetical protein ABMY26_00550 (plasmid) [Azospirillum sp. HJ39]|uniref:hypothetical protein n=1 Tax=Azospirillum sp. HJ39 TaxID=3159496 RepID=UPI0035571243